MQDISTTLKGRIGSEPMMKHVKGDICVTTFRLAITKWRFASNTGTGNASYVEDGAYWYTVETWDTLAANVFRSCRKGDPVIVVARPVPNGWIDGAGQVRSSIVYRASSVGHDLARGTSQFTKNGTHSTDVAAGGTEGDPYSTRAGSGSQVMSQAGSAEGELMHEPHSQAVAPGEGTGIPLDDSRTPGIVPTIHAPSADAQGSLTPAVTLEEHAGCEEDSSGLGESSSSCFDYSALDRAGAEAPKSEELEPIDGSADAPPDVA